MKWSGKTFLSKLETWITINHSCLCEFYYAVGSIVEVIRRRYGLLDGLKTAAPGEQVVIMAAKKKQIGTVDSQHLPLHWISQQHTYKTWLEICPSSIYKRRLFKRRWKPHQTLTSPRSQYIPRENTVHSWRHGDAQLWHKNPCCILVSCAFMEMLWTVWTSVPTQRGRPHLEWCESLPFAQRSTRRLLHHRSVESSCYTLSTVAKVISAIESMLFHYVCPHPTNPLTLTLS